MNNFYQKLLDSIKTTTKIAYTYYGKTHTYVELYEVIKKIYKFLKGRRNENIILYSSKSFNAYGAIYSILFSGNVWVPITPDMSASRNIEIIKMTGSKLIFSDTGIPESLEKIAIENKITVIQLDQLISQNSGIEVELPEYNENNIAYIMFTSGSTGTPKGVPMTHYNYINFIKNCMDILPFKENEIFSDYHDFAFDISIFYLFCCPLVQGAFSPVLTQEDIIMPLRFILENKVTVWSSVPSVIARIQSLKSDEIHTTNLRIMFICGEPFSLKVLKYSLENMSAENVYNFYGLTETGVENFYHKCSTDDLVEYEKFGFVPIGKTLPCNEIHVTSEKELLLSGCQLTLGYLGGVGADKFETIDGKRWFHTGDIVEKYNSVYFCKGRLDTQVKISGYRVELMDIEVNIKRFEGVEEAVCVVREKNNQKILLAVVKPRSNKMLAINSLKEFLLQKLPFYMMPKKIFIIEEMPVNKNGKIDRRQIKEMVKDK